MIEIDKISLLVTTDTDHSIEEIEVKVAKAGYTLNYHAVPDNEVLLLDVLNDRIPNLYGPAFGGIEDLCLQVRLAQPDGSVFSNVLTPRSATGPSLKKLAIGSQEMLGIPIQATLRLFYKPSVREVACVIFPSKVQRDFFLQAVYKFNIPLPLSCQLSLETIDRFFEDREVGSVVLGLALWGEASVVKNNLSFLQKLAEKKRGKWIVVEKGRVKTELMEILHQKALDGIQKKTQEEKMGSNTSIKIMRLIREIS